MEKTYKMCLKHEKSIKNNKVAYPGGLAGRLSGGSAVQIRGLPELRDQLDKSTARRAVVARPAALYLKTGAGRNRRSGAARFRAEDCPW